MRLFAVVALFFLFCCSSNPKDKLSQDKLRSKYFRESFLSKFKKLNLPCSVEHNPKEYILTGIDENSLDTLIFGDAGISCYGLLADTTDFYTAIFFAAAAHALPVIVTFDKAGHTISATSIDFGCWDGGPYDYTCSGGFVINPDMTITLNHETVVTKSYDDRDSTEVFPVKYPNSWKGKILMNGTIKIEKRPE
jgi:hypothetical protein